MAYQEIGPSSQFKFEKIGDWIEGRLVDKQTRNGRSGPYQQYILEVGEDRKAINGCTMLDDTLRSVPLGSLLQITYQGTKKTANLMDLKTFKVLADRESADSLENHLQS